jgi:outer membrane protein TolC
MVFLKLLRPLGAWALCLPISALAALGIDEATLIALEQAPALVAQQQALAGAQVAQPAAATLPDPKLTLGVDNLPLSGADRLSLTRDFMTMQRIGLMQDVPNAAKRLARGDGAQARIERERALLALAELTVRRESALAWLGVLFAERRAAGLAELESENRLLLGTLDARIANGKSMPADRAMARQEALALADRRDDAQRDINKARATLRRWVGARADDALADEPALPAVTLDRIRADLHRHAEIAAASANQAMAQAEVREADAEQRGDWGWEVVYSRRPQFGDMVSVQLSFELPWNRERRQQPLLAAKQKEVARLDAERDEMLRRHAEEIDAQAAELAALERQRERLAEQGLPLAAERVALALAGYEAGRSDLAAVLTARREAAETRLRLIDLDAQRLALRVRLNTWIAE